MFANFWPPQNVTTLYHFAYSTDLSPPDYFLFPKLKMKLTLNPLTWKIWWAPTNAIRWQMGFNSALKGLKGPQFADVAEIQEAVTDDLKKVQKRWIFGSFPENVRPLKSLFYMPMELLLNKMKGMCLPHVSSIFRKIGPKIFGPHCVDCWRHWKG